MNCCRKQVLSPFPLINPYFIIASRNKRWQKSNWNLKTSEIQSEPQDECTTVGLAYTPYTLHWGYYVCGVTCGVSLHYPLGVIWTVDKHYSMSFTSSRTFDRQDRGFEQILSAVCPLSSRPTVTSLRHQVWVCRRPGLDNQVRAQPPAVTPTTHVHWRRERLVLWHKQCPKVVPWLLTFCLNAQLGRR